MLSVSSSLSVLLVEDDSCDAVLFHRALEESNVTSCDVEVVGDGQAAIDYLGRVKQTPSLLFADINMPGMDGFDLLEWKRSNPAFHYIPVVMVSSSLSDADVTKAFQLGAKAFLFKPIEPDRLAEIFKKFARG
jgi:CheY-like chemotaxis protein